MNKYLFLGVFLLAFSLAEAQYYDQSVGLRLGNTSGVTYKNFLTEREAMEIMVSGRNHGIQLTGLYQVYKPLNLGDDFFLYYGGGAHVGSERWPEPYDAYPPAPVNPELQHNEFVMGVDGILGVEYRSRTPLTFGLDIKPYLQFVGFKYTHLEFWDVAVSVKFLL